VSTSAPVAFARVTLVHNPEAGDGASDGDTLCGWLRGAGYEPRLVVKGEDDLDEALAGDPGELVVVAGGDGTVAKVAFALAGRDIPIAIVPIGTANNVARRLGCGTDPRQVIAGLPTAGRRRVDLGQAVAGGRQQLFLEAVGTGLFARQLAAKERGKRLHRQGASPREQLADNLQTLLEALPGLPADELSLRLDGTDLSGCYLLVAALNLDAIGPRLALAPDADPGDGLLDLVLVAAEHRDELAGFLRAHLAEEPPGPPLPCRRGRRLELDCGRFPVHLDGDLWEPGDGDGGGPLVVELTPGASCFVVPAEP
jgi:diacylglycerol kinase (ATP)